MRTVLLAKRAPLLGLSIALLASFLTTMVISSQPASALTTATQVSAGGPTTCALMTGGNAYCWGDNTYGQFGNGTTTSDPTPQLVSGSHTWTAISTSANTYPGSETATTCGITTSNDAYCWGDNRYGTDGDGTTTPHNIPVLVSGSHLWSSISVGAVDVCGITTSSDAYCWGANTYGEAGNGTTGVEQDSPVLVSGSHLWSHIAEGANTTCGITTAGDAYCWGGNGSGELGDGDTTNTSAPTAVLGGHTWSQISDNWSTTCGVTTTGAAYCWGFNNGGQVGDGTTNNSSSPVALSGTWSLISAGFTTCGITTAGAGYCWGWNGDGSVGNGNTTNQHSATAVLGGYTFSNISAGQNYVQGSTVCGLALDGIIYCWGYNSQGEVGNGDTNNVNSPVEASLLYAAMSNTNLSVTITPTFTFSVGNQSSACNGESNFVLSAGTASTIALGNLAAGANASGGQALTVSGNSGGGFAVYLAGNQVSNDLRSGVHNWVDVTGTYASPAPLGGGEQFGYTYKDSTASSAVTNPASANFIALTSTREAVMGSGSSPIGSGCVSFDAQASASTPAGTYTATVIYTAVPTF